MESTLSLSDLAERDAPALMMTEELVVCLRACTLFATTNQAARVRLTDSGAGFASELSRVSNNGLDVLVEAAKFLNISRLTAGSMGSTLERLQSTFGDQAEQRSHARATERLKSEITICKKSAQDLEQRLLRWRGEVEAFQLTLTRTNERFIRESDGKDADIVRHTSEIDIAESELADAEVRKEDARGKYEAAQRYQRSLVYNARLPETLNTSNVGSTLLDLAWTTIRLGWSWYTSGVAVQDISKTEQEFEAQRKHAAECKSQIADAQFELQKLTKQSKQLTDFTKALKPTLQALVSLTDNLRALLAGFSTMEPLVLMLVRSQEETTAISQDAAATAATRGDVRDFTENVSAMAAWALKIEHLAWLYAGLIEGILINGLRNNNRNSGNPDDTLDLLHVSQRQQLYLTANESSASLIKTDIDSKYEAKRVALERRSQAARASRDRDDEKAREKARKQASRDAKGARIRGFFGRSNS